MKNPRPVVTYAEKTISLTQKHLNELQIVERKIMRMLIETVKTKNKEAG